MLNREEIVEKLKESGFGRYPNEEQAGVLADLFVSAGPTNFLDMQCNFSALMYILTEQQAIIGRLLEELIQAKMLNSVSLERVTNIYGNEEALTPVYSDLYKRFAWYYLQIKEAMTTEELKKADSWNPTTNLEPSDDTDPS